MTSDQAVVETQKRAAAEEAVRLVKSGMVIGLGTGTTARYFIDRLGIAVREGLKVQAVATSTKTREQAIACGIPVIDQPKGAIELAIDGADEIDPAVNCIKGRGGALLREKIVAHASRTFVLIADESKLVGRLGRGPVPIEVAPFLWQATSRAIASLGGQTELRMGEGVPFQTDNGNLILDTIFPSLDPQLAAALQTIPGVIEHGLFYGMARAAIVAGAGGLRTLGRLP